MSFVNLFWHSFICIIVLITISWCSNCLTPLRGECLSVIRNLEHQRLYFLFILWCNCLSKRISWPSILSICRFYLKNFKKIKHQLVAIVFISDAFNLFFSVQIWSQWYFKGCLAGRFSFCLFYIRVHRYI